MKNGIVPVLVLLIVLVVGSTGLWVLKSTNKKDTINNIRPTIEPTINELTVDKIVPLPREEDVVTNFFNLINERKVSEAISMMSKEMIGDDSTKQAWGVQFNDIKSINVLKIEPSSSHTYKVTLEAYVSSEAANAPIPFYGWEDNPNIRWVELVKEDNVWKINSLATGP